MWTTPIPAWAPTTPDQTSRPTVPADRPQLVLAPWRRARRRTARNPAGYTETLRRQAAQATTARACVAAASHATTAPPVAPAVHDSAEYESHERQEWERASSRTTAGRLWRAEP